MVLLMESWQVKYWLCGLALCLAAQIGCGAVEQTLFHETSDVASQAQQERQRAASKALARVLVRVSGTRNVLQNESVRSALAAADRYLEQYSYRRLDAADRPPFELVMNFQPQATTDILRRANEPVWSARRPAILAWIELGEGGARQVVSSLATAPSESMASWAALVEEEARRRGLPVVLPSRSQVLALGGAGGGGNVAEIARQQGAQIVLGGDLRLAGGRCDAEWNMVVDGQASQWRFAQQDQRECAAKAMDNVAEALSARYAFAADSGGKEPVMVQVDGVGTFEQYTRVLLMLRGLAVVDQVGVHSAGGGRVRYSVALKGELEQLRQGIRMQRLLVESDHQPDIVAPPPAVELAPAAVEPAAGAVAGAGPAPQVVPVAAGSVAAPVESSPVLYYHLQGGASQLSAVAPADA